MRGDVIDRYTAPTHRLFEVIGERQLPISTIGIGDGGNEIGMGCFAWEDLVAAVPYPAAPRIMCRTATHLALVAGTSNWGAYALALGAAAVRGLSCRGERFEPAAQQTLVERLVAKGGTVDGKTRRSEATVDGLPPDAYLQPLVEMRRVLDERVFRRP